MAMQSEPTTLQKNGNTYIHRSNDGDEKQTTTVHETLLYEPTTTKRLLAPDLHEHGAPRPSFLLAPLVSHIFCLHGELEPVPADSLHVLSVLHVIRDNLLCRHNHNTIEAQRVECPMVPVVRGAPHQLRPAQPNALGKEETQANRTKKATQAELV